MILVTDRLGKRNLTETEHLGYINLLLHHLPRSETDI